MLAEAVPDRRGVEQRLGRMLVGAVAGVDHRRVHDQRDRRRRAILAVADDQRVGPHRVQRPRRVLQRLALLDRACSTDSEIAEAPSRCAAVANDIAVRVEFS